MIPPLLNLKDDTDFSKALCHLRRIGYLAYERGEAVLRSVLRFCACVFLSVSLAAGQQRDARKVTFVEGPVRLIPHADVIAGDVPAYPRVAAGPGVDAKVAEAINATLEDDEAGLRPEALDCDAVGRKMHHDNHAWTRTLKVTMRGPRFLAYLATDDYACGAYPNIGMQHPLVFDLTTGREVDWKDFLPPDFNGVGQPGLRAKALEKAEGECKEVFDGDATISFALNLNARSGTLEATPDNLPHVVQACAETVALDTQMLRRFGVNKSLIDALDAAHALQKGSSGR